MAERLFADIERRFEAERRASRLGRRFRNWRAEHTPLERFESLDDLVGFFRDPSITYEPKDEIAGILCGHSPDDEDELTEWLTRHHEELLEEELNGWYTDPALWPRDRSLKMLKEWCSFELHTVVVDTSGSPLEDDEAEE